MMIADLIPKEEITNYKIINAPEDHSTELRDKLKGALRLGNAFKSKANIVFNTTSGPKRVETTIWNVTPDYLELKGGVLISTHSLLEIDY